ncbi:MAG: hypothetical protein RR514_05725 [Christensenella sp.]
MEQSMTVQDLLRQAMSVMGEEKRYEKGYAEYAVDLTNQLIVDLFECNNTRRIARGVLPLTEMPKMAALTDVIPFEYTVLVGVMRYGLAYWLLFADDENDKANICNANYETNKIKLSQGIWEDVTDVYGGDGF